MTVGGFSNYTDDCTTAGPGQGYYTGTITTPSGRSLHGIVYVTTIYGSFTATVNTIAEPPRHEILLVKKRMSRIVATFEESMRDFARFCERAMVRAVEARERRPKNGYTDRPENEFALTALLLPAPLTFRRTTRRRSHNRGPILNFCKLRPA